MSHVDESAFYDQLLQLRTQMLKNQETIQRQDNQIADMHRDSDKTKSRLEVADQTVVERDATIQEKDALIAQQANTILNQDVGTQKIVKHLSQNLQSASDKIEEVTSSNKKILGGVVAIVAISLTGGTILPAIAGATTTATTVASFGATALAGMGLVIAVKN